MSLCVNCSKNLSQNQEVKLKDNSVVCNRCAYNILREYYKEWYLKHPEKNYDEKPPKSERPISEEFEFLEIACRHCLESIAEHSKGEVAVSEAIAYDKCKGKKCPDCGKTRQEIYIKMKVFKNGFLGSWINCPQCKERKGYTLNSVCWDCFWERAREKNCVCCVTRSKMWWEYSCSLCKEIHVLDFKCEKCIENEKDKFWFENREAQQVPISRHLLIIVTSMVSCVIMAGLILGLYWKKLYKRTNKTKTKSPTKAKSAT